MKRALTQVSFLALMMTATGPALSADANGHYLAIKIDGISNYSFAYREGETSELLALVGDIENNFDVVAVGEIYGPDIKFAKAIIDRTGVVSKLPLSDNYLLDNGRDLMIDMGTFIAQLAIAGHGKSLQVNMRMGDQTRFVVDDQGEGKLTVFTIGSQTLGVYENPARTLNTVLLELLSDGHYRSRQIIGAYPLANIRSSVVDLTVAANARVVPASTGVGHGHREAVSA